MAVYGWGGTAGRRPVLSGARRESPSALAASVIPNGRAVPTPGLPRCFKQLYTTPGRRFGAVITAVRGGGGVRGYSMRSTHSSQLGNGSLFPPRCCWGTAAPDPTGLVAAARRGGGWEGRGGCGAVCPRPRAAAARGAPGTQVLSRPPLPPPAARSFL